MRGFGPISRSRRSVLPLAGLISVAIHGTLLAVVLVRLQRTPSATDAPPPMGAVELVMIENKGSGPPTSPVVPPPQPAAPQVPPQPPQPQQHDAAQAEATSSPPPSPPTPPPVPQAAVAPTINLGGGDDETDAIVTGPYVIPASVDARFHNKEPAYPLEAVRHAEQGAVTLVIHVSPQGLADGVDVAESSGFLVLDRAARDAVAGWRFRPAVGDSGPVPFDMTMRVVFRLD